MDIEMAATITTAPAMTQSVKATAHSFSLPASDDDGKTDSSVTTKRSHESTSSQSKLRAWLMWWNTEDWWPCWIGLLFFGCISAAVQHGIPEPYFIKWDTNPFMTFATPGNYGLIVIFFAMGLLLWLCMGMIGAAHWKQYPLGYFVVFVLALISNMLSANEHISKASINSSIWAIIFGCLLRNLIDWLGRPMPPALKLAQQTELYIATSLVLLCIDFSVLKPLAPRALFVSWIDTPLLFLVVAAVGWRFMGIDRQTSIILSGATFICGSSAAIALGASMGVMHKTQMPIAIISIFTIPSIIALPYIAKELGLTGDVSGAWFGGCVDSTGGVLAAASIYNSKEAVNTAAVVKMVQNVLIGPISVMMAWGWSKYEVRLERKREEEELLQHPSGQPQQHRKMRKMEKPHILLWKRFPKFVIGFIITAILFNTVIGGEPTMRSSINDYCFYVSEWFSTFSFVSIGLGLTIKEMKDNIRHLGKLSTLYIIAQTVDIAVTGLLAWVAFTFM